MINIAHFLSYMEIQKKFIKAFKKGDSIKTSSLLFGERRKRLMMKRVDFFKKK